MANIAVLYCGSYLVRNLYNKLLRLGQTPFLVPSNLPLDDILSFLPAGIIVSGSGSYVNSPLAETVDPGIYDCGIPVLGICYGMQRMAVDLGGSVLRMAKTERWLAHLNFDGEQSVLFRDFTPAGAPVWMAHTCKVAALPPGFSATGHTEESEIGAMEDRERQLYGVQFHPEHIGADRASQAGSAILWSFLDAVCGVGQP